MTVQLHMDRPLNLSDVKDPFTRMVYMDATVGQILALLYTISSMAGIGVGDISGLVFAHLLRTWDGMTDEEAEEAMARGEHYFEQRTGRAHVPDGEVV